MFDSIWPVGSTFSGLGKVRVFGFRVEDLVRFRPTQNLILYR